MKKFQKSGRGMTLVEMMIVGLLLTVIGGAIFTVLLVGRRTFLTSHTYLYVQQEGRRALSDMSKEVLQAGNVNGNVSFSGSQRMDFQILKGYDAVACGGFCWGTENATYPNGWIHYVLDTANVQQARLLRCVTANRLDAMPAGFAGCRVMANHVDPSLAATAFRYDHALRTVTFTLHTLVSSAQLPGGSVGTMPVPLTARVMLRNAS
ncbi:MAG: hypothetical protein HYT88_06485 [Candidatus Omnitrophica bacterium]|nr:hypothetical protein [Candidatus Omnitrophota bacterium]MBI3009715.1 hypothetical protein [Candidatus Omnitrophota bacterium]